MGWCRDNLLIAHEHMDQLVGLVDIGFNDFPRSDFSCFFVPGQNHITGLDRLYGYGSNYGQY